MLDAATYIAIVLWIGKAVTIFGGLCVLAAVIWGFAILSNMAQHAVLSSYGGWKVLEEFRDWYTNERIKAASAAAHGEGK